jgi:hypothetical protein
VARPITCGRTPPLHYLAPGCLTCRGRSATAATSRGHQHGAKFQLERKAQQLGAIASICGLIKSVWSTHQPTPIRLLQVSVSPAVDSCVFQRNPGTGSMNPTFITDSGLAQPQVGQLRTSGRNVVRLNPLIEFDPTLSRQFALKERPNFKLQVQVFYS